MTRAQEIALDSAHDAFWRIVRRGVAIVEWPPTEREQALVAEEHADFAAWSSKREAEMGRVLVGSPGWHLRIARGPEPVTCFPRYRTTMVAA